jgi:hypothetical protein
MLKNSNNNNDYNKEDNYKMLIMSKDKTIADLRSTLEVKVFDEFRLWK